VEVLSILLFYTLQVTALDRIRVSRILFLQHPWNQFLAPTKLQGCFSRRKTSSVSVRVLKLVSALAILSMRDCRCIFHFQNHAAPRQTGIGKLVGRPRSYFASPVLEGGGREAAILKTKVFVPVCASCFEDFAPRGTTGTVLDPWWSVIWRLVSFDAVITLICCTCYGNLDAHSIIQFLSLEMIVENWSLARSCHAKGGCLG
jgi:hypothetical protein